MGRLKAIFTGHSPSRPAAGSVWTGPATYTTDPTIGRPGYYALADVQAEDHEDGSTTNVHPIVQPPILLTWVDDDPTDEENMGGHYVVAAEDEPYYPQQPASLNPRVVPLQAETRGTSEVSAQ